MRENENSMSVVLLDEFDHCDSETWEAFYHVFDEGKNLFLTLFLLLMLMMICAMQFIKCGGFIMLYHIISYHIISYHIISYHIISYHDIT